MTGLKTSLTNQPYLLFLLAGIVLIMMTFFTVGQSVDFHLHDTYFVISVNYFFWGLCVIFFIAWGIYAFTNRFLDKKTCMGARFDNYVCFIALINNYIWHEKISPPIKKDAISFENVIYEQERERIIAYSIIAIFVFGQAAYGVNLIVGLLKRRYTNLQK